jgi:hypothetical protein
MTAHRPIDYPDPEAKTLSQLQMIFNCEKFTRCLNSFPTPLQRMVANPGWMAPKEGGAANKA